ncbi:MAG: GrpB family protein [Pseudomonadales bacterium]|nr:GrpB family protein [Pseudomonadales bacterium]
MSRVVVVPHDECWKQRFSSESERILSAVEIVSLKLQHIGSTSIPGICAKPVVDVLGEVASLDEIDGKNDVMVELGYEVRGEFGLKGRRYFSRDNEQGHRVFNVHIYKTGSSEIARHVAFRDYLLVHPDIAQKYSELKIALAEKHPESIEDYMDGKDAFIKRVEADAIRWQGAA